MMGIVGKPSERKAFWANKPMFKLNDCECGGSQYNRVPADRDVTIGYGGDRNAPWMVMCRRCWKTVRGKTAEDAAKRWNGKDDVKPYE